MRNVPRVSVCMAVYNGEKYIRQQIESVLSELQDDDELVICDDFSIDNTASIIEEFHSDKRVKFFQNPQKLGVVKNFDFALRKAQGAYVFLCDQDDVWLPGKVSVCIRGLLDHSLVVTDCVVVDEDLKMLFPSFFELRNSGAGVLKNIWKNTYLGCCMAFRRDLLSVSLPIPEIMPMHDMWLGLLAEANGEVLFIDEKLSLYRRHQLVASHAAGVSGFSKGKQLKVRLILIWCLFCRVCKNKCTNFIKKRI